MGTVSQLHDRTRPSAHLIESEEEAIEVARALSAEFARRASERDMNRIMPSAELDAVSQSGLLGITIPAEYGGLDISNMILAEIVALLAEGDASIAAVVHTHFHVLEAIRSGAVEDQRAFFFSRALSGDRFGQAGGGLPAGSDTDFSLAPDGQGHRITGRAANALGVLFADWIAAHTLDSVSRPVIAVLSRNMDCIQLIDDWDSFGLRTRGSGTLVFHGAYVDGKGLIAHHKTLERPATVRAVADLLHAAIDFGIARAAFAGALTIVQPQYPQSGSDIQTQVLARIGQLAVAIEAAAATIERAGKKVDIAQVSPLPTTFRDAELSTQIAGVVSSQLAMDAANALFSLAGPGATKVGLNLDRHWRDARAHTVAGRPDETHQAIGAHHLNGLGGGASG